LLALLVLQEIIGATFSYVTHLTALCGTADDVYAAAAFAAQAERGGKGFIANADAAKIVRRVRHQSALSLCTMLNNVYAAEAKLQDLWREIARGWRNAVGERGMQVRRRRCSNPHPDPKP
jgi:hypothetical protein